MSITPARRIALTADGKIPESFYAELRPGDYCGPIMGYTGSVPAVFFLKPNARDRDAPPRARAVQHVTSPPHSFRECRDGSLEIRESISNLAGGVGDDGWHGYLDEGNRWRRA